MVGTGRAQEWPVLAHNGRQARLMAFINAWGQGDRSEGPKTRNTGQKPDRRFSVKIFRDSKSLLLNGASVWS
jgi:hypothetical protein